MELVNMRMGSLKGFTLIELIVILLIIGIIARFTVPRLLNLSTSADQNTVRSVAAALAAASSENFNKRTASSSQGSAVTNCTNVGSLLPDGLPTGYVITSSAVSNGASAQCTLTSPNGNTATFTVIGIT